MVASKKKGAPAPEQPTALDFIYAGKRCGKGGGFVDALYILDAKGNWDADRVSHYKAQRTARIIGGIYTGANFTTGSANFTKQIWTGKRFHDKAIVLSWEAKHLEAVKIRRQEALEKDEAKASLIESELEGVRGIYAAMRSRGDFAGCDSLERLVVNALRTGKAKRGES